VGLFPIDSVTIQWLRNRADFIVERGLEGVPSDKDGVKGQHPRMNHDRIRQIVDDHLTADPDAFYSKEITMDLSTIAPHVAGPDNVKTAAPIKEISDHNIKINKAYLVSCTNSREDDLAQAADAVRGKKVAENVEFYFAQLPAKSRVLVKKMVTGRHCWRQVLVLCLPGAECVSDWGLDYSEKMKLEFLQQIAILKDEWVIQLRRLIWHLLL